MVFHEQSTSITPQIQKLDQELTYLNIRNHCIHTGPIIRGEEDYYHYPIEFRRRILNKFVSFVRSLNVNYASVVIEKSPASNSINNIKALGRKLAEFIDAHRGFFSQYDVLKVYYDNGQIELTQLLAATFSTLVPEVEFRKVVPKDYKLFQVADLVCTLKLINLRLTAGKASKSDLRFFMSIRDLKKNYIKPLKTKELTV